jgi:hypothetical protein
VETNTFLWHAINNNIESKQATVRILGVILLSNLCSGVIL